MGSINSREQLEQCTAEQVAQYVTDMGEKYEDYSESILSKGVDGRLVSSSLTKDALEETMDDIGIKRRLHRRKLERVVNKIVSEGDSTIGSSTAESTESDSSTGSPSAIFDMLSSRASSNPSQRDSTSSSSSRRGHRKTPSDVPVDLVMECALAAQATDNTNSFSATVPDVLKAALAAQALENENLQQDVLQLETERTLDRPPEEGLVTIVLTDVEGSTSLWEANPTAMRDALALHDTLVRQLREKNHGYEIDTEGDAFFLAFSEPSDALAFALELQEGLQEAQWSDEILATAYGCDDGERRGLRVRMSIHMGEVETLKNPVTGRTEYSGEGMDVAQKVEKMARGGQILATVDTWNAASCLADVKLGSPTVQEFHKPLFLMEDDMDASTSSQSSHKRLVEITPSTMKELSSATVKKTTSQPSTLVMKLPSPVPEKALAMAGSLSPKSLSPKSLSPKHSASSLPKMVFPDYEHHTSHHIEHPVSQWHETQPQMRNA